MCARFQLYSSTNQKIHWKNVKFGFEVKILVNTDKQEKYGPLISRLLVTISALKLDPSWQENARNIVKLQKRLIQDSLQINQYFKSTMAQIHWFHTGV